MVFQESFKQKSQKRPFLWNLTQDPLSLGSKSSKNFILRRWPHVAPKRPLVQGQFFCAPRWVAFFRSCGKSFPTQFFACQGETIADLFFEERPSLRWLMRNTPKMALLKRRKCLFRMFRMFYKSPMFPQNPRRSSWSSTCGNQVLEPSPKNRSRNDRIPSGPIHFQVLCHVRSVSWAFSAFILCKHPTLFLLGAI